MNEHHSFIRFVKLKLKLTSNTFLWLGLTQSATSDNVSVAVMVVPAVMLCVYSVVCILGVGL